MSSPSSPDRVEMPPPAALAIHLDLVGGIAGDMFVAAMVDALPALETRILEELAAVRPADATMPAFTDVASAGLRARRFGLAPGPAGSFRIATRASPGAMGSAGTAYSELRRRLQESPLTLATREHALALLALLADAEARVHGTTIDDVHFHELGDWDSLMDVVAAGCVAANLDGTQWTATSLPLGGGTVRTAHGALPVPAPATSLLLEGYPWRDDGIAGERVTPTGAAILRHLVPASACGARRVAGRLLRSGSGAGMRALPGMPNIVRASVFERELAADVSDIDGDVVAVIEFDVDDMTGEEIALAADRLRALHDVIDASVGTRTGKKGRPLAEFRLLAQPSAATAVARACFIETSTLGLRLRDDRRYVLRRVEVMSGNPGGDALRVKLAVRPGGVRTGKAAHDDVAGDPGLDERRQTRAAAEQRALEDDER